MSLNRFIFATGIECSYPTVEGGNRRDQLEETKHYQNWRTDFELCRDLGIRFLRYGLPYYRIHTGPHSYDWSWPDEVLPVARDMGLEIIADLCHFGVPDWVGGFTNTDWPELFVDYAEAFCKRYPWIRFYTPVNEIQICARFSGRYGWWNDQKADDTSFVRALITQCRSTLLSIERILQFRPDAVFIQSEAAEALYTEEDSRKEEVDFENQLRFFTFDFLYGHPVHPDVLMFLFDHGESRENYYGAIEYGQRLGRHCIMGMDFYKENERSIKSDGSHEPIGPVLGWEAIGRTYFDRYKKPMLLSETNCREMPTRWLWNTWHALDALRAQGVPVVGFTWYSLQNQVDWDIQLREVKGTENQNGLYDLSRNANPVAEEYRRLIKLRGDRPLLDNFPLVGIT